MDDTARKVTIHLARLGKPERSYTEGFVDDNGIRLKTFSIVPEGIGIPLSEKFQQQGWIRQGQTIHSVAKYLFYNEYFDIVVYQEQTGKALGYYCDIATPLQKKNGDYFLTDLILDLWIFPDFQFMELDRDEFETAISEGLVPLAFEKASRETLYRLSLEIQMGIFPTRCLELEENQS